MKQDSLNSFFGGSKGKSRRILQEIEPNNEQKLIIEEDKSRHLEIKACAGSGKTTTILCRVKHLIEVEKVNASRILITAFNIDAAKHVRYRLSQLLNEKLEKMITVNNIDKLSRHWVASARKVQVDQLSVREYTAKVVEIMKSDSSFREKIAKQFDYVFFDEFQDITPDEYALLKMFAGEGVIISLVGDDAQNIYSFRENKSEGDTVSYATTLQMLQSDFPGIKRHFLSTNYRSTDQIVQFANAVLASSRQDYGYQMQMLSHPPNNIDNATLPECAKFMSISEENRAIIDHINELTQNGYAFDKIAVLSRTNKPLQFLEEALEIYNSNILKLNSNTSNMSGTRDIRENIQLYIPFVAQISDSKEKQTKLKFKPNLIVNSHAKRVTLTTIHKSKGLEWDVVFLIGLNDDFFPGTNKIKEVEEERRVFYVGVTRAKKKLQMSFVWNKKNQNLSRFVSEVKTNLRSGYNEPMISEQLKCNEQMRQIDLIKSKTIILSEIVELLSKEHYEQLRSLGCLDLKKESIQIHFKCSLGQYILENNLVSEFATFFKIYLIRCIGEEFIKSDGQENSRREEDDVFAPAFQNKFCSQVLFGQGMHSMEMGGNSQKASFALDAGLLCTQYIQDQQKREEILKSLILFQDRKQNSDSILKHIFNVAMCSSIFNQRRRLLHKEDAFKHFEFNKNILKNGKKSFIPELFRKTATSDYKKAESSQKGEKFTGVVSKNSGINESFKLNGENVLQNGEKSMLSNSAIVSGGASKRIRTPLIQLNETLFSESFSIKADYDVICDDCIFEIRFQQLHILKPEDLIQLIAKVAIVEEVWKTKIKSVCVYFPLQGELTTINMSGKEAVLLDVLKVLYKARQEKQDACSTGSKSVASSPHNSQLQISQSMIRGIDFESDEAKSQGSADISIKLKKVTTFEYDEDGICNQLDQRYINEQEDPDIYMHEFVNPSKQGYLAKKKGTLSSCSSSKSNDNLYKNRSHHQNSINGGVSQMLMNEEDIIMPTDSKNNNNFGFIKASDIAGAKVALQNKKSLVSQQKCMQEISIGTKIQSSSSYKQPETISKNTFINKSSFNSKQSFFDDI